MSTPIGGWHQDLGCGAAGLALVHIARARIYDLPRCSTSCRIKAMTAKPITANAAASLFHGAPAVAYVLRTGTDPAYAAMLAKLDMSIDDLTELKMSAVFERMARGELTQPSEYDLISGLTGLGLYHLLRYGSERRGMAEAVLELLVALTEPICRHGESLPGLWSATGPTGLADPSWPDGHLNLGMAHGVAGVLALLSGAMRRGVQVAGQDKAIIELCAIFDRYRRGCADQPWWPAMVSFDEYKHGSASHGRQGRPSWCYGTPGQARAQQLAGLVLNDYTRVRMAEHALAGCVHDRQAADQLTDASLCHGWAGVVQTLRRACHDALDPQPLHEALRIAQRSLEGHLARVGPPQADGLLEGRSGVRLAQDDSPGAVGEFPQWDACLLLAL
jgi:lantibiotic biosynthesis protein